MRSRTYVIVTRTLARLVCYLQEFESSMESSRLTYISL
jgi:hypothetical protein